MIELKTLSIISILLMSIFTIAILSSNHFVYSLDATTTVVIPHPSSTHIGQPITFKANVPDTGGAAGSPTGTVSWNDGGAGGSFSSYTCTLATSPTTVSNCSVVYTPPSSVGSVTINATYPGDSTHAGSSGISALTVNLRATTINIRIIDECCNFVGGFIPVHIKVTDSSAGVKSPPRYYSLILSDNGAGGTFRGTCPYIQPANSGEAFSTCFATYFAPARVVSPNITATYVPNDVRDGTHAGSSLIAGLTLPPRSTSTTVSANSSSIAHGTSIRYFANVYDATGGASSFPVGTVSWNDGSAGGSFSRSICNLTQFDSTNFRSICNVLYTAPATSGIVTITGTYGGEPVHISSSGHSTLTVS